MQNNDNNSLLYISPPNFDWCWIKRIVIIIMMIENWSFQKKKIISKFIYLTMILRILNPFSVGLIFDNFLWGVGGGIGCTPSKIGPNWGRKNLKTYLESSQKIMRGIIYTQNAKKCHEKSNVFCFLSGILLI